MAVDLRSVVSPTYTTITTIIMIVCLLYVDLYIPHMNSGLNNLFVFSAGVL